MEETEEKKSTNRVQVVIDKMKSNPIISSIIIIGVVVISIGSFTKAIIDIQEFFETLTVRSSEDNNSIRKNEDNREIFIEEDFDNFDSSIWDSAGVNLDNTIVQSDGFLQIKEIGSPETFVGLYTADPIYTDSMDIDKPFFIEISMFVDPNFSTGDSLINLGANMLNGKTFMSQCHNHYDEGRGWSSCWDKNFEKEEEQGMYITHNKDFEPGSWHTYRIEVDLKTYHFTYMIDNRIIGEHTPPDADKLGSSEFWISFGLWSENSKSSAAYFDNLRVRQ